MKKQTFILIHFLKKDLTDTEKALFSKFMTKL
jgi:hypothetical protein